MRMIEEMKIKKYIYDTIEERNEHVELMESRGYECTGQVRKSFDLLTDIHRKHSWYGEFIKYKRYE